MRLDSFGLRAGGLEYSPTTAPKRLPVRTYSDKSHAISDLMRVNIGIDTSESQVPPPPAIWFPEINDISARSSRWTRQFPGDPVKSSARDISSAFKRAQLRPDYAEIFPSWRCPVHRSLGRYRLGAVGVAILFRRFACNFCDVYRSYTSGTPYRGISKWILVGAGAFSFGIFVDGAIL